MRLTGTCITAILLNLVASWLMDARQEFFEAIFFRSAKLAADIIQIPVIFMFWSLRSRPVGLVVTWIFPAFFKLLLSSSKVGLLTETNDEPGNILPAVCSFKIVLAGKQCFS